MSNQERYWINAAIYVLLAALFGEGDMSFVSLVAMIACYALSAGYFVAMVVSVIRGGAK